MKKIAIIGAGGINSWLAEKIHFAIKTKQLNPAIQFHIFDNDAVEEKNITYQNFKVDDIMLNKAEVLANKYLLIDHQEFVLLPEQLDPFDIVICGVDNRVFRELMFRYMEEHPEKYWIDLRAEGRTISYYTKAPANTLEHLLAGLPESTASASCQLEWERQAGVIQYGNQIIAAMGVQLLLNHLRGDFNAAEYIGRV